MLYHYLLLIASGGGLKVCAVKAPAFGDRRKAMLDDIAVLTNGQVIREELGLRVDTTTLQELGRAKQRSSSQKMIRQSSAAKEIKEKITERAFPLSSIRLKRRSIITRKKGSKSVLLLRSWGVLVL